MTTPGVFVSVPDMIGSTGFSYDNLIYPASTNHFDIDGLLFTDGVSYLNLCNLEGEPFYDTYALYDPNSTDLGNYLYYDSMDFAVSPVPEPSTIALFLLGGCGIALRGRQRRRAADAESGTGPILEG